LTFCDSRRRRRESGIRVHHGDVVDTEYILAAGDGGRAATILAQPSLARGVSVIAGLETTH
jgi:hypothetical protein